MGQQFFSRHFSKETMPARQTQAKDPDGSTNHVHHPETA
jgi:hypothetical protein